MVIVHRHLTQLHKPDPAKKRDINPVLGYCWYSAAADGSILNRLSSRVCGKRGVGVSLFARLPLIKPYNCDAHLCSRLIKYCLIDNFAT